MLIPKNCGVTVKSMTGSQDPKAKCVSIFLGRRPRVVDLKSVRAYESEWHETLF